MMRSSIGVVLVLVTLLVSPAFAATPDQIEAAIQKAKAFVYSQQKEGIWEKRADPPPDSMRKEKGFNYKIDGGQWGGLTALATYALVAGGDSAQDPKLVPATKFLQKADIKGVYALGMKCQLYTYLPMSEELRKQARNDARLLRDGVQETGNARGLYDYLVDIHNTKRIDHSVSQYGVLGVWACERAGIEISNGYWSDVEKAWIGDQDPSGGWCYGEKPSAKYPVTASMTAAGVATLFITQDYLHADAGIKCRGNITNDHIEAGLKWITDNFQKVFDTSANHAPWYALYGIERIGVASGLKYFGSVNWYETGADFLVKHQNPDGSFADSSHKGDAVPNTCFAILFLSRGRAPVVFNKLQYDIAAAAGNWNQRPRDIANIVRYISRQTERDLNWQITSLKAPMPELHDAPIIYLAGNQALSFAPEEEAKLKQFCEEGGIIFGNADCGNADFATSFRKLGAKLFPGYEFRELPASHPIYTNEQYLRTNWKSPPSPLALSNGVREMMVVQPTADAARYWQADDPSGREEAFQFADNLFLYAVDKQNLLEKGKTYLVYDDERIKPQQRIKMGRLEYDGNWDPEPAGWRRMSALLHNMGDKLELFPIKLGSGKLGNGRGVGVRVAHLTGTTRFKLNLEQRKELKEFAEGGGTLIIDAAGGSGEFADSAESELAAIFGGDVPNQLKEPLPPADHVYDLPGNKIEDFGYRPFTRKIVGTLRGPQVKAIKVNDRPAVYYSREDLSAGLVGQPVDGIIGYTPTTATAIMRNLILQGGGVGDKPASTQPAPEAAATQPGAPKPPTPPKPKSPSRKPKSTTKPTTKPATKPKT